MTMEELSKYADWLHIPVEGKSKFHLIRDIQDAEGGDRCFGQPEADCPFAECEFFEECMAAYRACAV